MKKSEKKLKKVEKKLRKNWKKKLKKVGKKLGKNQEKVGKKLEKVRIFFKNRLKKSWNFFDFFQLFFSTHHPDQMSEGS